LVASAVVLPLLQPFTVRAADTPVAAVDAVLDAIVAKDLEASAPLVCEEKRDEVVGAFDLATLYGASGPDAGTLVDALRLSIEGRAVTELSQVEDTASVQVEGTLVAGVDETTARAWVGRALQLAGQPTDDASVDGFLADFLAVLAAGTDLTSTVDVVRRDGDWQLCDDLGPALADVSFDPGASLAPPVDPLCDTMTVEELDAATGLAFVTATPFDHGCSWDSDLAAEYYNVSIHLDQGDLAFIKEVWTGGRDLEVGGKPAWATRNGTWVDLGDGLLTIMPYLEGAPSTASLDPIAIAKTVGDIVVPRLP
jgi:hypothetical protein